METKLATVLNKCILYVLFAVSLMGIGCGRAADATVTFGVDKRAQHVRVRVGGREVDAGRLAMPFGKDVEITCSGDWSDNARSSFLKVEYWQPSKTGSPHIQPFISGKQVGDHEEMTGLFRPATRTQTQLLITAEVFTRDKLASEKRVVFSREVTFEDWRGKRG